jgi:hypothetical protein
VLAVGETHQRSTTPAKLSETAATVMRILSSTVTAYTQIKATNHL